MSMLQTIQYFRANHIVYVTEDTIYLVLSYCLCYRPHNFSGQIIFSMLKTIQYFESKSNYQNSVEMGKIVPIQCEKW